MPANSAGQIESISEELDRGNSWYGMFSLESATGQAIELDWRFSVHSVPGLWLAIATDARDRLNGSKPNANSFCQRTGSTGRRGTGKSTER